MNSHIDESFFARLRVQNDTFAAALPTLLQRLASMCAAQSGAAPCAVQSAELGELLHMLAGAAVTFGYRRLGLDARCIEQRLRVLQAFPVVPLSEWGGWFAGLDQLLAWACIDPKAHYTTADLVQ